MRILRTHHYILIILERMYTKYTEKKSRMQLQKNTELWKFLINYKKDSLSGGASFSDFWLLYNFIRQVKPREVLECGTGVTTIIMAHAMLENEKENGVIGRITSMEESEEWYRRAQDLLPSALVPYVDIRCSPKITDIYYLFHGVRYKDIPERPYEFVFIDGPQTSTPESSMGRKIKTFDFDFIRIVERTERPVFAFVDTRMSTCWALSIVLREGKVRYHYGRDVGLIGPCTKEDLLDTNGMIRNLGPHPVKRYSLRRDIMRVFQY